MTNFCDATTIIGPSAAADDLPAEVTGIDQDVRLNRAIWALAEQMRAIKASH